MCDIACSNGNRNKLFKDSIVNVGMKATLLVSRVLIQPKDIGLRLISRKTQC